MDPQLIAVLIGLAFYGYAIFFAIKVIVTRRLMFHKGNILSMIGGTAYWDEITGSAAVFWGWVLLVILLTVPGIMVWDNYRQVREYLRFRQQVEETCQRASCPPELLKAFETPSP